MLGPSLTDPRARFRLTSRIAGYTGLPAAASSGVAEYELQPLTPEDVSGLITAWGLPDGLASRLRTHISGSPLGEAARIPLLIALLCAIAQDDEDLPRYTAGIYDRVLRRFLAQENRWPAAPRPEPTDIDRLTGILAPLAYHFASRPEGWTDRMPASQIMTIMRSLGPAFTELGADAASLLRDLSVRAGVLIPAAAQHAGHNPPYLFLHRTIAEHLTACHLAALPRADWLDILRQHVWFDPAWQPVIALLGAAFVQQERPAEAIHLIKVLLTQPYDPFHQVLYHAASAAAELPDPALLPADLTDEITERLVTLLDSDPDSETAVGFLQRHLNRLPWPVTQALLARLDTSPGWTIPQILAASNDPRVIARLTRFMDTCSDGAEYVCTALKAHGAERYEREMLARFDNEVQRRWAASVLREIPALQDITALLPYATDADPEARLCALHALGGREDPRLLDALCQMAADPEPDVRTAAADELIRQSELSAIQAVRVLCDDDDPLVSLRALKAVILDDRADLAEILAFACHSSPYARACAAQALGAHPRSPQAGPALRALTTDPDPHVRGRAAQALARHPCEETATALIGLLDDPHCSRKACQALRSCNNPGTAHLIQYWLEAELTSERMVTAARALEGISGPEATAQLLRYLASEHQAVREAAAYALAGREDDSVGTALTRSLKDPSPWVRQAAVTALQSTPVIAELVPSLLALLADKHAGVRAAAATALAISERHPEVTAALLKLLADERLTVREAVATRFGNATTPVALLAICTLADLQKILELPLPRDNVEQLAVNTYRALPDQARTKVLQELAQLRLAASPYEVIRTNVSPDWVNDDILDLEIVILLQGPNQDGEAVYSYTKMLGASLKRVFTVMCEGRSFVSSDYGKVLFADTGEVPEEIREIMRQKYNMQDNMDYPAKKRLWNPSGP